MRGNVDFPSLPNDHGYEASEQKYCEAENCGKQFVRKIGSISRICGQCRAKADRIAERMAKEDQMLKAKALTEKVQ